MIDHCSRCGASGVSAVPLYRPTGMAWFTPPDFAAKSESTCAKCSTADELARLLHPVADFVLSRIPRDAQFPEHAIALDIAQSYFMVRNNDPNKERSRNVALRAAGLTS